VRTQISKDYWLRTSGKRVIVGLTDEGLRKAENAISLELPVMGITLRAGDEFITIKTEEGAFTMASPLTGQVVEVNWELAKMPELLTAPCDSWLAIFIPSDYVPLEKK
jgi:glycine cleavage system H lipoate-binding protein